MHHNILTSIILAAAFLLPAFGSDAQTDTRTPWSCVTTEGRTYVNPTGDEFPIMGYHAFWPEYSTVENYRTLRDCGINIAQGWSQDSADVPAQFRAAEEAGVKVLVNCSATHHTDQLISLEQRLNADPVNIGYLLWDEPKTEQFGKINERINAVVDVDSVKLAYVNLLPNYATTKQLGADTYAGYLEQFMTEARPQLLSYDFYCILKGKDGIQLRKGYFENLEEARKCSRRHNAPLWTFCLSTPHFGYAYPDEAQLTFEAFTALAYGSKCIQYYGYGPSIIDGTYSAITPVDSLGNRSDIWYAMQKTNAQIQTVGQRLLRCDSKNVWHTGTTIPAGSVRLTQSMLPRPFYSVVSQSAGVTVSHHTDGSRNYLLIVNKDFLSKQRVSVRRAPGVRRINEKGRELSESKVNYTLKPGSWLLFEW